MTEKQLKLWDQTILNMSLKNYNCNNGWELGYKRKTYPQDYGQYLNSLGSNHLKQQSLTEVMTEFTYKMFRLACKECTWCASDQLPEVLIPNQVKLSHNNIIIFIVISQEAIVFRTNWVSVSTYCHYWSVYLSPTRFFSHSGVFL